MADVWIGCLVIQVRGVREARHQVTQRVTCTPLVSPSRQTVDLMSQVAGSARGKIRVAISWALQHIVLCVP
jgi:hypothetical protein